MPFMRRRPRRTYRRRTRRLVPRTIKRYVTKAIDRNIEDKFSTNTMRFIMGSISNAWIEVCVNLWSQGTSTGTRVGRKVQIKSLFIYGTIAGGDSESALDDPYNNVRFVIGLYDGSAGATPLTTANMNIDSVIKRDSCRFLRRKYYDKYIVFNVASTEKGGGDGYAPTIKKFRYYKRFKRPINVWFADDTNLYPSIRLVMSAISDSAAIPNPGFVNGYWVVKYQDA